MGCMKKVYNEAEVFYWKIVNTDTSIFYMIIANG